jgi:hypothetical protein
MVYPTMDQAVVKKFPFVSGFLFFSSFFWMFFFFYQPIGDLRFKNVKHGEVEDLKKHRSTNN